MDEVLQNNDQKTIDNKSFKQNIAFNLIVQILTYFIPLIITPYITRVLGVTGVGTASYVLSIVGYFSIIVSWGFDSYGSKKISASRDCKEEYSKIFWNIYLGKLFIFLVSFSVYFSLCYLGVFGDTIDINIYLVASILIFAQFTNITFLFSGIEKFKIISIVQLITNAILLLLVFLLVKKPQDVYIFVILKTSQLLLSFLILWFISSRYLVKPVFSFQTLRNCFVESIPFLVPALAPTLATSIDQTMIGTLSSIDEVAYYQESLKIILLICALFYSVSPVGLSRFSYLFKQGKIDEVVEKTQGLFNLLSFVIFPSIAGLYAIGRFIIVAYLGFDFQPSVYVLYILLPMLFTSSINSVLMNCYYYPVGKTKFVAFVFASSLTLNISLNILFIRLWGSVGAAISTLLTDSSQMLLLFIFCSKTMKLTKMFSKTYKSLLCSIIMGAFVFAIGLLLNMNGFSNLVIIIITVIVGVVSYLAFCLLIKEPISQIALAKIRRKAK